MVTKKLLQTRSKLLNFLMVKYTPNQKGPSEESPLCFFNL